MATDIMVGATRIIKLHKLTLKQQSKASSSQTIQRCIDNMTSTAAIAHKHTLQQKWNLHSF